MCETARRKTTVQSESNLPTVLAAKHRGSPLFSEFLGFRRPSAAYGNIKLTFVQPRRAGIQCLDWKIFLSFVTSRYVAALLRRLALPRGFPRVFQRLQTSSRRQKMQVLSIFFNRNYDLGASAKLKRPFRIACARSIALGLRIKTRTEVSAQPPHVKGHSGCNSAQMPGRNGVAATMTGVAVYNLQAPQPV